MNRRYIPLAMLAVPLALGLTACGGSSHAATGRSHAASSPSPSSVDQTQGTVRNPDEAYRMIAAQAALSAVWRALGQAGRDGVCAADRVSEYRTANVLRKAAAKNAGVTVTQGDAVALLRVSCGE